MTVKFLFFVEKKNKSEVVFNTPFNYTGSKYHLIEDIRKYLPNKIETFVDAFGGGFNVGINTEAKRIWLNLELAKKPKECIEYIIVHELVHLLERSHNQNFVKFMNQFMPKWRFYRDELNRLPFSHVRWTDGN